MRPVIIFVKNRTKEGKIILTEKELRELLEEVEEAYTQGYEDAKEKYEFTLTTPDTTDWWKKYPYPSTEPIIYTNTSEGVSSTDLGDINVSGEHEILTRYFK